MSNRQKKSKNPKFVYPRIEKNIGKTVLLFSITGEWLIGLRWGFLTIGRNELRISRK